MVTYFNRKDMVSFGRYLLSEERTKRIKDNHEVDDPCTLEERLRDVYHADVENWKFNKKVDE